jgi:uncharacterized protein
VSAWRLTYATRATAKASGPFNVAISRAQCVAYVVAGPRLLNIDCRSPEQMRLVNSVCQFAEIADRS